MVSQGSSVIFISHDLPAVRTIADRVTVLRDGSVVATASMADVSDEQIVEYIVGPVKSRELQRHGAAAPRSARVVDRSAAGLRVTGLQGGRLQSFDLDVARGETVGIAGLLGSGAEDVPYLLFGAVKGDRWDASRCADRTVEPRQAASGRGGAAWACRSSRPIASATASPARSRSTAT